LVELIEIKATGFIDLTDNQAGYEITRDDIENVDTDKSTGHQMGMVDGYKESSYRS
jgi:hypothetical protein